MFDKITDKNMLAPFNGVDLTNTEVTMQVFMVSKCTLEFGTLFVNTALGN